MKVEAAVARTAAALTSVAAATEEVPTVQAARVSTIATKAKMSQLPHLQTVLNRTQASIITVTAANMEILRIATVVIRAKVDLR